MIFRFATAIITALRRGQSQYQSVWRNLFGGTALPVDVFDSIYEYNAITYREQGIYFQRFEDRGINL
jgi:hypothetical protein